MMVGIGQDRRRGSEFVRPGGRRCVSTDLMGLHPRRHALAPRNAV
jgi:hypothetical protein